MAAVRIGDVDAFPENQGVRVDVGEHRVAVFRIEDTFYAIGDRCSHAEASLAEGEVFDGDVECPRHGSEFSLETGKPGALPATQPVPVYEINVVDGDVMLVIGEDQT
ncbi:MAG TPA: non-heme iron oxygenase ferredoxin subunit [Actinobacteria bacterium]|nr:anthranilate 1,2-dioxygenase ferredoxin subunit [bacterium BMS3Bbin02]HDL42116.1 non-heme iron oxygenase ferredoxin subunit [Actinomycetota bacterium]